MSSLLCPSSFHTQPFIRPYGALDLTNPVPSGKARSDPLTTLLVATLQWKQHPHFQEEETKAGQMPCSRQPAEVRGHWEAPGFQRRISAKSET